MNIPANDLGGGPLVAGSPFSTTLALTAGDRDDAATGYTGAEAVSAAIAAGEGLPAVLAPAVAWQSPFDAAAPAVVLSWDDGDTDDIDPATYYVYLTIDGATRVVGTLTFVGGIGTGEIAPDPLITIAEMRAIVGNWYESLQTLATTAGLKRSLSQATDDLYEAIAQRYAADTPRNLYATRRAAMRASLDEGGNLTTTRPMKNYVAHRAAWYLTHLAVGTKDSSGQIRMIADRSDYEASKSLRMVIASVAGYPDPIYLGGPVRVLRG